MTKSHWLGAFALSLSLCGACGDKTIDESPEDDRANAGANTGDNAKDDRSGDTSIKQADAGDDGKLVTCENVSCGALPSGSKCADGSDAQPSCLKREDGICVWKFLCGGVDGPDASNAGSDAFCGGFAGIACKDGEYCDFGSTCGAADQGGTCKAITSGCTFDYSPVCGCDGKTYPNACAAASEGMSVLYLGECGDPTPCSSCKAPMPGAPNYQCKDGVHFGGPACVAHEGKGCDWQFLKCPEEK